MDLYLTIRRTSGGAWAIAINGHYKERQYIGYSKRDALKLYRAEHGLKGKHIDVYER